MTDAGAEIVQTSPELTRAYAELSKDFNPLHLDADFAARTPFSEVIVHGSHTLAMVVDCLERNSAGRALQATEVRFVAPVPVGTKIVLHVIPDPGNAEQVRVRVDDGGGCIFLEGAARYALPYPEQGTTE